MRTYTIAKAFLAVTIIFQLLQLNIPITALAGNVGQQIYSAVETGKQALFLESTSLPTLEALTPNHMKSGGAGFTLQIQGQGFIKDTVVSWNNVIKSTTFISSTLLEAAISPLDISKPGKVSVFVVNPGPESGESNLFEFTIDPHLYYLPAIIHYFAPTPYIPYLHIIDNSSQNNNYSVWWNSSEYAAAYRLQEATDSDFNDAIQVYDGPNLSWITTFPGKNPGTYYYRVQSYNQFDVSKWSAAQSVIISPPGIPVLNPIDNSNQNNSYQVTWGAGSYSTAYRLQEATDPSFVNAVQTFDGSALAWVTPYPGKAPGIYFYRVQSYNAFGPSEWSASQSVTVYPPAVPVLNPIDNADQNNTYTVAWGTASFSTAYRLQEAADPAFANAVQTFDGSALAWVTPNPGKFPGTYYYRVQSYSAFGASGWSAPQSVTIYPLFVGLNVRMDGNGYIRGSSYADIGTHYTVYFDALTEADTIRGNGHQWYSPNPYSWTEDFWTSYYSVLTGNWKGDPGSGDPSWKWGYNAFLSYNLQLTNNMTIMVDNQPFTVTGPLTGISAWGKTIQYWQFVNQQQFQYWADGSDWVQYVHAGEAILRYDAGSSRLLIYNNIKRHYYYQGAITQDTVQYIEILSQATSIPGSPAMLNPVLPGPSVQINPSPISSYPLKGMDAPRR